MISKRNSILTLGMLVCFHAANGMRNPNDGISGLDDEAAIGLLSRDISINQAVINNSEDLSHHTYNVSQHAEPNTLSGSIKKGIHGGIEAVATKLTIDAIMFPLSKGWELLTQESPSAQEKLTLTTIDEFNRIALLQANLTSLQSKATDKETIEGYNKLIKQCKDKMDQILKNHLAQIREHTEKTDAKKSPEIAG